MPASPKSYDQGMTTHSDGAPEGGRLVRAFRQGHGELTDLLGGKSAQLAEMTSLGLPVPQGFTIDLPP